MDRLYNLEQKLLRKQSEDDKRSKAVLTKGKDLQRNYQLELLYRKLIVKEKQCVDVNKKRKVKANVNTK